MKLAIQAGLRSLESREIAIWGPVPLMIAASFFSPRRQNKISTIRLQLLTWTERFKSAYCDTSPTTPPSPSIISPSSQCRKWYEASRMLRKDTRPSRWRSVTVRILHFAHLAHKMDPYSYSYCYCYWWHSIATSNDPWGPTGTEMSEIAQITYNSYAPCHAPLGRGSDLIFSM
jgi:hypothetical protein